MTFLAALFKIGKIMQALNIVGTVVAPILQRENKIPTCEETTLILQQFKKLVESGVIDIPNVDEKELIKNLEELNDNLVCSIGEAHRNVALTGSVKVRGETV